MILLSPTPDKIIYTRTIGSLEEYDARRTAFDTLSSMDNAIVIPITFCTKTLLLKLL